MNRKIIFLDIDGTFIGMGQTEPPASAVEAIRRARENGHLVYLCTGRNYGMLSPMLQYGFDGVIANAGGYILCGEELIYNCPMEEELRERTVRILGEHGVARMLEGLDAAYVDPSVPDFMEREAPDGGSSELKRWKEAMEREMNLRPIAEYAGEPLYKIVIMCQDGEQMMRAYEPLQEDFLLCLQDFTKNGFANGELINRRFDKGQAVRRVCEHLGVAVADTFGFGDSMNDKEMIETAGVGLCMADGNAKLREIADDICPPAVEDGLYKMFEKYGLI